MKVGQLIDKLQSLDRELEVFPYTEEPEVVAEGHSFRLFHIEASTSLWASCPRQATAFQVRSSGRVPPPAALSSCT